MANFLIIHNPRCSKSRETLKLLEERGIHPTVVDYLGGELDRDLLTRVIKALNLHPKDLLRTKEEEFQRLNLDLNNQDEIIDAILTHPKILERPIVLKDDTGVIGRPPENILKLF